MVIRLKVRWEEGNKKNRGVRVRFESRARCTGHTISLKKKKKRIYIRVKIILAESILVSSHIGTRSVCVCVYRFFLLLLLFSLRRRRQSVDRVCI